MAIGKNKVKMQTVIDKELAEKIDYFAERFDVSQSKMISMILEIAIENDAWLMETMSSSAVKKIISVFGKKQKPVISFEGGDNG